MQSRFLRPRASWTLSLAAAYRPVPQAARVSRRVRPWWGPRPRPRRQARRRRTHRPTAQWERRSHDLGQWRARGDMAGGPIAGGDGPGDAGRPTAAPLPARESSSFGNRAGATWRTVCRYRVPARPATRLAARRPAGRRVNSRRQPGPHRSRAAIAPAMADAPPKIYRHFLIGPDGRFCRRRIPRRRGRRVDRFP